MANLWRLPGEEYRGLEIRCAPGVHAACVDELARRVPPSTRILDLASGTGAFVARLRDAGFLDVVATERDVGHYAFTDVPVHRVDLDTEFAPAVGGPYGAVTAIEIIEHLSSPLAFLREIRKLVGTGGWVIVSTPNIVELQSRLKFLLRGELRYFDERQYRFQRHISPVVPNLVPMLLAEAGFELVRMTAAGSFDGPLRRRTVGVAARIVSRATSLGLATGDCLVIAARAT